VIGAATLAVFYFLTLFMQIVLGYSALRTGFGFLAFAVGAGATAGASGRLIERTGPRPLVGIGVLAVAAGLFWLSYLDIDAQFSTDLAGPLVLAGSGVGLCFVPLTLAAVVRVDDSTRGVASALLNTCQQVGGALGLAVFGTIASTATRDRLDAAVPGLGSQEGAATDGSMPPELMRLFGGALAHGYGVAYLVAAVTLVAGCVLAVATIGEVADDAPAAPVG